ncbi:MAG: MFS transporter [Promethearchaeota archaeon]
MEAPTGGVRRETPEEKNGRSQVEFKVDVKQTIFIGFGFLSCMIAWSFYNFKIPIILNGITGSEPGTWTRVGILGTAPVMEIVGGAIMTLDNIIAILLQPYFGQLSDRLESRHGRRTPFVVIGIPTAVVCLFLLPLTELAGSDPLTVAVLFIAIILVFNLAMAFYRPPVMSILPDKTPPQVLSTANSFIGLMGGVGFIVGMLAPTLAELVPGTEPVVTGEFATQDFFWEDFWGFALTGAFMAACLLVFLWKVHEVPTGEKFFHVGRVPVKVDVYTQRVVESGPDANGTGEGVDAAGGEKPGFFGAWKEIRKDEEKSALWVLLAVFSYLFGFNALEFSFGRFATSYLQISQGSASLLLAIMPVMLIVAAVPAGVLATKYGRLRIMKVGLVVMAACTVGIILALSEVGDILRERPITLMDLVPLIALLSVAGIGYGLTHINALPVVWQLAPKEKVGSYTGVYYMVSALGSILSPIFMSSIYALVRGAGGNQWLALFPYFLVGIVVGFAFVTKVKRGDAEPLTPEELARLRALYATED